MKNLKKRDSFIDKYDKIVNLAISETQHIRGTYRNQLVVVAALLAVIIFGAAWLISDNISGYEKILDEKFNEILLSTEEKQDSLNRQFVIETRERIEDLIAKNFSDKEILKTINLVATEKVDSVSNQYLDSLVDIKITPKLNSILTELDTSESKIQLIDFYVSKFMALNDDRFSFERLVEISKDRKHKYSDYSKQVVEQVILRYSQKKVPTLSSFLMTLEKRDFEWTFKKCYDNFYLYPKDGRLTILSNVFSLDKFSEEEKITIAMLALRTDESLTVVKKASSFLIKKFELPYRYLEIHKILDFLEKK